MHVVIYSMIPLDRRVLLNLGVVGTAWQVLGCQFHLGDLADLSAVDVKKMTTLTTQAVFFVCGKPPLMCNVWSLDHLGSAAWIFFNTNERGPKLA